MSATPRVVVDSYNLRLAKGSGIKTYGLSLLKTLRHLNADISLLADRQIQRGEKTLEEVSFFDQRTLRRPMRGQWILKGMNRTFFSVAATTLNPRIVVSEPGPFNPGERQYDRIYNVPDVFDAALKQWTITGVDTRVSVKQPVDIWHATTALPVRVKGAASVTTIHDLIPLRLPYTTLDNKRIFHRLIKRAVARSDLILTVSEHSKRDLLDIYGMDEDKVQVTWQSLPEMPKLHPDMARSTLKARNLTSGNYILFVGNIEPKKNLLPLIKAVSAIDSDIPLVLVGAKAWLWEEVMEQGPRYLGHRFKHLNYVDSDELAALYQHARAMVFPSIYEGFGLPPLEAMRHGCPVVCSKLTSLPEVCADAALYFDPQRPDQIREQLQRVIDDDALRDSLIEKGRERVQFFELEAYAKRIEQAYQTVL